MFFFSIYSFIYFFFQEIALKNNQLFVFHDSKFFLINQEHVEGYHELSAKTKIFFSTAVAKWDADFYVKVDDDVHVNLGDYMNPF